MRSFAIRFVAPSSVTFHVKPPVSVDCLFHVKPQSEKRFHVERGVMEWLRVVRAGR